MTSATPEHQEDVSQQLTVSAIVFSVICPLLVALRIFGRVRLRQQLGIDDVAIILAVVLLSCFLFYTSLSLSAFLYKG